jgi:WD40 repeat protein
MAVRALKYNPEHKVLVSGSDDLHINLIDYSTCKVIQALVGHKESISKIEYNQYLNLYASSSLDGTVKLWDFRNRESKCVQTISLSNETNNNIIWDIAFSNMGDYLVASTENNSLVIFNKS